MKRILLLLVLIPGLVLAYGYWHSFTHGSAYIDLLFESNTAQHDLFSKAEVSFMDIHDNVLATGVRDEEQNYIYLIHPEAGNCYESVKTLKFKERRKQWPECYEKLSIWIPTWINNVHHVQVKHKNCLSKNIPVEVSAYNKEWLLWWVPLPHVGGKPYSHFKLSIHITENDCIK